MFGERRGLVGRLSSLSRLARQRCFGLSRAITAGIGESAPFTKAEACQAADDGWPACSFRPTNYKSGSELFVAPSATKQEPCPI
jgi:hypothetical protein